MNTTEYNEAVAAELLDDSLEDLRLAATQVPMAEALLARMKASLHEAAAAALEAGATGEQVAEIVAEASV